MRSRKLVAGIGVINEGLGKWSKWLSQSTYIQDRRKKKITMTSQEIVLYLEEVVGSEDFLAAGEEYTEKTYAMLYFAASPV